MKLFAAMNLRALALNTAVCDMSEDLPLYQNALKFTDWGQFVTMRHCRGPHKSCNVAQEVTKGSIENQSVYGLSEVPPFEKCSYYEDRTEQGKSRHLYQY